MQSWIFWHSMETTCFQILWQIHQRLEFLSCESMVKFSCVPCFAVDQLIFLGNIPCLLGPLSEVANLIHPRQIRSLMKEN